MKSLILVVWGWCPHLSCYVSELFEIPSTSCHSTKNNCFSQVCNLFCRFQAPPLLSGFESFHMQPSLQHTHTVSSSLLSLSVFSPILSSQLEVFLPFSLCLISLSFQLLLESVNSLFLSYFLLPLMYVLVCHFFFFSYISPSNSHSFFHICTPKPLKSSPILTHFLATWSRPPLITLQSDFFVNTLLKLQS